MPSPRDLLEVIQEKHALYTASQTVNVAGLKSLKKPVASLAIPSTPERFKLSTSVLDCVPLEVTAAGAFVDPQTQRKVILKGINVDSNMKIPVSPYLPSMVGDATDPSNVFFDGDTVSFVGRPFPLDEAELHFQRIKSWGYNTVRYLLTWEAIEHEGPGRYDEDFLDYTVKVLRILHKVGGLYVFLEMHQDVWSRYSGGSGAPMWTFYAAGLDPRAFAATEAAIFHNDPRFKAASDASAGDEYPKMIWTTNYKRLASMVMFTFFFAGNNYFSGCTLDGKNIQDYLRDCYYGCVEKVWTTVLRELPKMVQDGTLLGFELMNEPNCGLVGHENLGLLEPSQHLRVGTTPTAFQSFKLGMGLPCEIDEYRIAITGPQKYATVVVDPQGARAWILPAMGAKMDKHYGWTRNPKWTLGECIFAQHGIWDYTNVDFGALPAQTLQQRLRIAETSTTLRQPNYFNQIYNIYPRPVSPDITAIDKRYFINHQFVDFYVQHKHTIRKHWPQAFVLMQTPVLEVPPDLASDPRCIVDRRTVYCPHYYDGMSLMFKTWNTRYNVDTLGIMRDRYLNPVLGIVFGEKAIRNCIRKQFADMKSECHAHLGAIPVLMSETGMPYDMDDKRAFDNGKYYLQTAAMDAINYALESAGISVTFWCYNSNNCHKWGDRWNNEDFSLWSPDDRNRPSNDVSSRRVSLYLIKSMRRSRRPSRIESRIANGRSRSAESRIANGRSGSAESASSGSNDPSSPLAALAHLAPLAPESPFGSPVAPAARNLSDFNSDDDTASLLSSTVISSTSANIQYNHTQKCYPSPDGVRAVSAVVRPFVIATRGDVLSTSFDLKAVTFSLTMTLNKAAGAPTVIFVPKWHYPYLDLGDIYVSSGSVKYNETLEYLEWHHEADKDERKSKECIVIKNNSGQLEREDFECSSTSADEKCIIS